MITRKQGVFRRRTSLLAAALCLGLLCSCSIGKGQREGAEAKDWCLLLYDDADFNKAYDALDDFSKYAYAHENLHVLVLQDAENGPSLMWQIGENHQRIPLKPFPELNMAAGKTLADFLSYAKENYPARHTVLCLYDHGSGAWGACGDKTDPQDILTMDEMQRAIAGVGGIDLICFTAPCLMGAVESVYELRDCVQAYIGSENTSGYMWWDRTIMLICATLRNEPGISAQDLAARLVQFMIPENQALYPDRFPVSFTMSAVRTDRISAVAQAVDALAKALLPRVTELQERWHVQGPAARSFGSYRYCYDLVDLAEVVAADLHDPELQILAGQVKDAVASSILYEGHGEQLRGSHGLTIYFPDPQKVPFDPYYGDPELHLDFASDTAWCQFLAAVFGSSSQRLPFSIEMLPKNNGWQPGDFALTAGDQK